MKFQYVSDLHLEIWKTLPNIEKRAPYLILSGDVGDPSEPIYNDFLKKMSHLFDEIFLISGNHEYYAENKTIEEMDHLIYELSSKFTNVHYLQNSVYHLHNISIFGGTFWTTIKPEESTLIKMMIADYRKIKDFTIETSNNLHKKAVETLKMSLKEYPDNKWLVISHHIPKNSLVLEKFKKSPFNSAFASDIECCDDLNIKAWVFGHTHEPSIQGKFYSNPVGYPNENKNIDYNRTFTLNV